MSPPPALSVRVSVERDWIKVGYPFPSNPVMLAVSCFFFCPTAAAGEFVLVERCSHSETQNVDVSGFSRHKSRVSHCIYPIQNHSNAQEIQDIIMFCCALGSWHSILFLFGDNAESKGRFFLWLLSSCFMLLGRRKYKLFGVIV